MALVAYNSSSSSTPMAVLARIEGLVSPVQLINTITSAISLHSPTIEALRAKRIEEQTARQIRQGQDSAYHASLARDRERTRQIAQERERIAREEQLAAETLRKKEIARQKSDQWRKWRVNEFIKEPTGPQTTKINFRLHSGQRIVRHFNRDSDIDILYAFIQCQDLLVDENCRFTNIQKPENYHHEYRFRLISPFPRKIFEPEMAGSLEAYKELSPNGSLLVERIEDLTTD
ncbi:UBX domain-containing protein 10 [Neolecta irregularis DAH-3]|uniref:UBX domain-containing protein 10 n=1 Tax=Neolecta irregularis (strain DAH-3) TaxID=1198029 RepID=A0A1U7LWF6_NEOID|nr:UBX domain-containing protein 10 [Neolecta irregularis DAH-3]|eukprot:OLL27015.1 UBX domain-containing protein 10 [Neolecta irregularis DAH-3]